MPPVSPSLSEGALSDAGSEDSGGRLKNYMQTLMEDYESHKVKRRDKLEDNSVSIEPHRSHQNNRGGVPTCGPGNTWVCLICISGP